MIDYVEHADYVATCEYLRKFKIKRHYALCMVVMKEYLRRVSVEDVTKDEFYTIGEVMKARDGPTTFRVFDGAFVHAINGNFKKGEENEQEKQVDERNS